MMNDRIEKFDGQDERRTTGTDPRLKRFEGMEERIKESRQSKADRVARALRAANRKVPLFRQS